MAELMTIEEVASYLRLTKMTIYRLLKRGDIPATKIGRQWRFDRAAIDDWLRHHSVGRKARILVVDDENIIRELFKEGLGEQGHRVITAEDGYKGLELLKQRDFDIVFVDLKMVGMDGAELLGQIKAIKPDLPVVVITGYPDSDMMARALSQSPFAVMNKPFGEQDIIEVVNSFLGSTVSKMSC